jgi:hypothetical protein
MAEQIERLNAGQTPSLLQAAKGNELIDAINALRKSKSTQSADIAGISLTTKSDGSLELNITSDLLEKLNPQTEKEDGEATTDIASGFVEQRFNATVNGVSTGTVFLVKIG